MNKECHGDSRGNESEDYFLISKKSPHSKVSEMRTGDGTPDIP